MVLDIGLESIGQAVSNSLLMFCFCNLIIVIILRGSKQGSTAEQDIPSSTSHACNKWKSSAGEVDDWKQQIDEFPVDASWVSEKCQENIEDGEQIGRHDDDDGFRTRVEEFIAKVNEEWKNEKLRALHSVIE